MKSQFKTVKFWVRYNPDTKMVIDLYGSERKAREEKRTSEVVLRVSGIYLPKKPKA